MVKLSATEGISKKYPEVWKNRNVRCVIDKNLPCKPVYEFFKRLIDIVGSVLGLTLLSWVLVAAAVLIKLEDGGPVFFSQTRVGKGGRFFKMYKLRSMVVNADTQKKALMLQNECDGPVFKMENDPRITRVGVFLRKTSIDELPQLINILKGEMSIVGPRPPLGHEVMQYDEYAMRRLSVKPGLTCYWQCSGRSSLNFDEWMAMDMKYIDDRGFWTDIKLMLKTVPAVIKGNGAY